MGCCFRVKRHAAITEMRSPGAVTTITLPRGSVQLSNKGGELRLLDREGRTVHFVSFTRAQAMREGETVVF